MKRLTTDKPSNNTEAMLNYAYAKDGYVHLSYADGEEDVRLTEYLCRAAQEIGCEFATEENILNGDMCLECDCKVSILNVLAIQAAELRERLKKYEDAEEQGLLVRLPCKVGDTVYRVIRGKKGRGHIAPATVSGLHLGDTTRNRRYQKEYEYLVLRVDGGFCAHVNKKDIGKTVFLTREEAEKALEDA